MPQKQVPPKHEDEQEVEAPKESIRDEELAAETDALLDDIDEILEAHTEAEAEAWVAGFVQKGGE